mgnify:CR=1 FL=1
MTQHTLTRTDVRRAATGREPWWIPFGEPISSLFRVPAPAPDATRTLPSEVLRDYDPALHRALAARVAGRNLDAGPRPLLY